MSLEDSDNPPTAPKWSRMPPHLRLQLVAAVEEHRRLHRARFYDLLRNDRRFSPWIGPHLGWRGEKYLDRVVAGVREAEARLTRLRRAPQRPSFASSHALEEGSENSVGIETLANAGGPSFAELMADLVQQRELLKAEAEACLDEQGLVVKFDRWTKIGAELRTVGRAIADLTKQYQDVWQRGALQKELFACVAQELRDQPARGRALTARLNAVMRNAVGVAASPEASNA